MISAEVVFSSRKRQNLPVRIEEERRRNSGRFLTDLYAVRNTLFFLLTTDEHLFHLQFLCLLFYLHSATNIYKSSKCLRDSLRRIGERMVLKLIFG